MRQRRQPPRSSSVKTKAVFGRPVRMLALLADLTSEGNMSGPRAGGHPSVGPVTAT